MRTTMLRLLCLAGALAASGCSLEGDDGRGSVAFSTWGEAFILEGIPASEFEDGWSVRFGKFLIVIGGVTVADGDVVAATQQRPIVFDLTKPGVVPVVSFQDLAARPWPDVSYQLGPIGIEAELGPGVTEADKKLLLDAGAVLRVEAVATRGTETKSFSWSFTRPTRFVGCHGEKDGRTLRGVSVTRGGLDEVQLTIHGDHLFYDDLQAANAKLRFQPLADADADRDGIITQAELAAVQLAKIPAEQGPYGTGSAPDVNTLADYVAALTRTLGHFRGEGECVTQSLP